MSSWTLSLYDCAVRYAPHAPLPLRGKVRTLRYSTNRSPFFVRIGSSDASVAEEIFVRDVYAAVTSLPLGELKVIVDLGANVGATLVHWINRYPHAKLVAVEPDPDNLSIARKNAAAAGGDVTLVQACISDKAGTVSLDRAHDACAYRMADATEGGLVVPAMTMDQLLDQNVPAQMDVDLLKIDIEGAEQAVFANCRSWIKRVRALVIELHEPYSSEMFLSDLAANGSDLKLVSRETISGNPVLVLRTET